MRYAAFDQTWSSAAAVVVNHGLTAAPDVVYVEWLADPGISARWWRNSVSPTQISIGYAGVGAGVPVRIHTWAWHSIQYVGT